MNNINDKTQVLMSSVYKRSQIKREDKPTAKRMFSYVINGLLLSAVVVGAVVTAPPMHADASSMPIVPQTQITQVVQQAPTQTSMQKQDQAAISNLRMANKVLQAAVKSGDLDGFIFDNMTKKLDNLSERIEAGGLEDQAAVQTLVQDTAKILQASGKVSTSAEIAAKRASSVAALQQLQSKLADSPIVAEARAQTEVLTQTSGSVNVQMSHLGASRAPSIYLNGTKQPYVGSLAGDSTLVPMRGIFESLGATVNYSGGKITATKGSTVIKLTIGSKSAVVNGKSVTLSVAAKNANGTTMVPLRFVSEALGATVKWDAANNKISIDANGSGGSTGGSGNTDWSGVTIRYGGHNYGSTSQGEYNQVMAKVDGAVSSTSASSISPYTLEYLDGARWDGNRGNQSPRNVGLRDAEVRLSSLVQAGVSKDTIIKLIVANGASSKLTQGHENLPDGGLKSAADLLLRGLRDCNSLAYTQAAVFDAAGFNTAILARPGHAYLVVEASPGNWYTLSTGGFYKSDFRGNDAPGGEFVKMSPTYL